MFSFPLRKISHYTGIFSCPFSHFQGGIFQTMSEFFRSFPHPHSINREKTIKVDAQAFDTCSALQIILEICIPVKELAKTRSQI